MASRELAATLINGLIYVGGTTRDIERANAMFDDANYDGVQALYQDLEEDMWAQTRKEKDEARGKHGHG